MTTYWWVLVILAISFGIAGRIDYEVEQATWASRVEHAGR